jgi:membrane-associated phospholipid phosphatase
MKRKASKRRFTRSAAGLAGALLFALTGTPAIADAPAATQAMAPANGLRGLVRVTAEDTREVFKAPVHWRQPEWRSAVYKALVVAGAMALADESVRDHLQEHRTQRTDRIADAFEPFGSQYAAGVLLGYGLIGTLADKPGARSVALDGAVSSVIAAGLVVPALKEITGRSRPRVDQGAHDFHPFSGSASFPSGHTAEAFALATVIAENNDRLWVKGLAYGVATLVAYSRMESDAHFLSDVTAGAMIGVGVARHVVKLDRERRRSR